MELGICRIHFVLDHSILETQRKSSLQSNLKALPLSLSLSLVEIHPSEQFWEYLVGTLRQASSSLWGTAGPKRLVLGLTQMSSVWLLASGGRQMRSFPCPATAVAPWKPG